MIKQHTCYTAACDQCKEEFEGGYYDGIRHYDDQDTAEVECLGAGADWIRVAAPDSRMLCPVCVETLTASGQIVPVGDDEDVDDYVTHRAAGQLVPVPVCEGQLEIAVAGAEQ